MRVNYTATQLIDFVSAAHHLDNQIAVQNIPNPIPRSRFFHLANDRYTIKIPRTQRDLPLADDEDTLSLGFQSANNRIESILTTRSSTKLAARVLIDSKNTPPEIIDLLSDHLVIGTNDKHLVGFQNCLQLLCLIF